jgi:hypothetical protein
VGSIEKDASPLRALPGPRLCKAQRQRMGLQQAFSILELAITEMYRKHLVLFGMQNRDFRSYLAANNRILISVMLYKLPTGAIRCTFLRLYSKHS